MCVWRINVETHRNPTLHVGLFDVSANLSAYAPLVGIAVEWSGTIFSAPAIARPAMDDSMGELAAMDEEIS